MTKFNKYFVFLSLVISSVFPLPAISQILPNALFGITASQTQATMQQSAVPANSMVPDTGSATAVVPAATVAMPVGPREQYVVVNPAPPGRMFGSHLFSRDFRGTLNQGFNPDYVVSIGDRVQVRLWGAFNFDGALTIDAQGNIYIPNVGPIAIAGVCRTAQCSGRAGHPPDFQGEYRCLRRYWMLRNL